MITDRKLAAEINPLIDTDGNPATLGKVRDMLFLLEDINAEGLELGAPESQRAIFHILYCIQHAIDFEIADQGGAK